MFRSKVQFNRKSHAGFSLLELILVLSIVVTIAALAVPNLMSMVGENAVFAQADQLRDALGEARRFSIETGIDYEVRYEVGGRHLVVLPNDVTTNETTEQTSTRTDQQYYALLPLEEGITIRRAKGEEEQSEILDSSRFGDLGGSELSRLRWSTPVMFRFDGTADDFTFRVSNNEGLTSDVSLRGLTGTTRVSQVYPEDEL